MRRPVSSCLALILGVCLAPSPVRADSITLNVSCDTTIGGCTSGSLGTMTLVDNGEDLELLAELVNTIEQDGPQAGSLLRLWLNYHELLFESVNDFETLSLDENLSSGGEFGLLALAEPHVVSVSLQAFNLDPSFGIKGANGLVFQPMGEHGHANEEPVTAVPEPASLLLFGTGLAASAARAFRRRRRHGATAGTGL